MLFPEQIVGLLTDKPDTVGVVFTVIDRVAEFALKQSGSIGTVNVKV